MSKVVKIFSLILRFAEFVSGIVVLGLITNFLVQYNKTHTLDDHNREIYTDAVAVVSVVSAALWCIPALHDALQWPFDLVLCVAWFAAFSLLVNYPGHEFCGGVFEWQDLTDGGYCSRWKATEAFGFISACCWCVSAALGAYVFHILRPKSKKKEAKEPCSP